MSGPATRRELFGTDGIRGVANAHPVTAEIALGLGRAIGARIGSSGGGRPRVLIGRDTRVSGQMLESALAAGLCSAGADALLAGVLPTPAVACLIEELGAAAGVVISASHNLYLDNGMKVFGRDGFKLPDGLELELEALIRANGSGWTPPESGAVGRVEIVQDASARYVERARHCFPADLSLEGLRIGVDCAHGATAAVAPRVLGALGARVEPMGVAPDGVNINHGVGALHPEVVGELVRQTGAHVGVALDGDGDRCILVDEHGETIDGDQIMAMIARRLISAGELPENTVVATVMSNIGLERALREVGGRMIRAAVGDRYVVERLRADALRFGGEQSGHIIDLAHATTGDGLVTALAVLAIMVREQRPLSELAACMTRFPQILINLPVQRKLPLDTLPGSQAAIRAVETRLGDAGRVLVRYSGTENLARVMVEGPDVETVTHAAREIRAALQTELC